MCWEFFDEMYVKGKEEPGVVQKGTCSVPDQGVLGPFPPRRRRPYGQTAQR